MVLYAGVGTQYVAPPVPWQPAPNTRTEFVGVETRLGNIDFVAGVATFTIVSRYLIYRTNYRTNYRTITYSIVSRVATAVNRTYQLEFGNIRSQFTTVIPTFLVLEVRTFTLTETAGVAQSPSPSPTQTPQMLRLAPSSL